ncbi:hypothetical protein RJT34_19170 [Clitoria ternatea]|uniref:UspA domain-containing protein n=1 Tax=Clitoria ternatea TaxID=43366 RepID=A0AAN9IR00_CLITE
MSEEAKNERRLLVAVDGGGESMHALSWSLKNLVIENSRDTLILLYVKPPKEPCNSCTTSGRLLKLDVCKAIDKYSQNVANHAIERAKKLCEDLQHVKVETRVENGDPKTVISEMSEKLNADILIMGTDGYDGVQRRDFLGSVSNHCSQNVKCPVLIVKKPGSSSSSDDDF